MIENFGQAGIPTLCHSPELLHRTGLFIVVIDVEVFSLEHFEIEILVPNLVLPKILRREIVRKCRDCQKQNCRQQASGSHKASFALNVSVVSMPHNVGASVDTVRLPSLKLTASKLPKEEKRGPEVNTRSKVCVSGS